MNFNTRLLLCLFLSASLWMGCGSDDKSTPKTTAPKAKVKVPAFNADNAYSNVEKQLAFGHRIPGTDEHKACKDWLVSELKQYADDVEVQEFKASFLGLEDQESYNIIASFKPKLNSRIMLAAHWDSRLIAEKDPDESKQDDPIMGADDGGSGVGVLLEIARLLKENPIDLGVDIVLFDAEDNGVTSNSDSDSDTWCLGSQYWGKNPHVKNYKAKFGILLDMVGAKDAQFPYEGISYQNAKGTQAKIWDWAHRIGKGAYFKKTPVGGITDDHYYVMKYRKFPMVDIINLPMKDGKSFGHYHHTHEDDINIIDKNTLQAVGQVVTVVLYKEAEGSF